MKAFINARVVSGGRIINTNVITENGVITELADRFENAEEIIDCKGNYLSSGFVDLHVHGGGGYSAMSEDINEIAAMCKAHAMHGTTSITPTTLAAQIPQLRKAINNISGAAEICEDSNILGTHLEGPFISKKMKGAQAIENILEPTDENIDALLCDGKGITMIGAAPEVEGAFNLAKRATQLGITVSVAHTDCSFEIAEEALDHGFSDVTHLYSACSQMHKNGIYREVGIVEAALCRDEYTTQFIADLRHIPVGAVKLIYKCKGADRAYAITDGLEYSAYDIADGTIIHQENGVDALCENGVMMLADRSCLAGSISSGDILLKNLWKQAGIPLPDAVKMMTETPLSVINYRGKKGRIEKGFDADIIVFDENVNIKYVQTAKKTVINRL